MTRPRRQVKLPATALFARASQPQRAGFEVFRGTPSLIKSNFRIAILADAQANPTALQRPLRKASFNCDLLRQDWTPTRPMLLWGGNADRTDFFNMYRTGAKTNFYARSVSDPAQTMLELDSALAGPSDPFAAATPGFATRKVGTVAAGGVKAVLQVYHASRVPTLCNAAAKGNFPSSQPPSDADHQPHPEPLP